MKKSGMPLTIGSVPSRVALTGSQDAVSGVEDWLEWGVWVEVISSNVKAIAYDQETRTLSVEFDGKGSRPNTIYAYLGVPREVARDFFLASSMGKYLDQRIKKAGFPHRGPL